MFCPETRFAHFGAMSFTGVVALALCSLPAVAQGKAVQVNPRDAGSGAIPIVRLRFQDEPVTLKMGQKGAVMTALSSCSDGEYFNLIADAPETGEFILHSLDFEEQEKSYRANGLAGYAEVGTPTRFFAGTYVAELQRGRKASSLFEAAAEEFTPLVTVFQRDGTFVAGFALPAGFEPKTIGVFPATGDVLVIGLDAAGGASENQTRLSLFTSTGEWIRDLQLHDDDPNGAGDLRKKQAFAGLYGGGAFEFAQVVEVKDDLLLVPTMTNQPLLRLNEIGVVRGIEVHLPEGVVFDSALDVSGLPWQFKTFTHVERSPPTMRSGPIVMINPADGRIERMVERDEADPAAKRSRVVCARQGEYMALTSDKDSGKLLMVTATIPQ